MTSDRVSPGEYESGPGRELTAEQAAAAAMVTDARARGLALTGPDGLLKLFTNSLFHRDSAGQRRVSIRFRMVIAAMAMSARRGQQQSRSNTCQPLSSATACSPRQRIRA